MKAKELSPKNSTWRGYTLEELRYEKVIALARVHIERARFFDAAQTTRESLPIVGNSSASGIFKSIGKLEYLIMAIKIFLKFRSLFKKKRN